MVIVDNIHLKSKYKGTMIVGVVMDGYNQQYPLAYAIVDSENDQALKWFMTNLKTAIEECPNLVFVPYRGQSIANVVDIVFLNSYHGLCTFHLKRNMEKYFKDEAIRKLFHDACRVYRKLEFKHHWVQIVNYKNGSLARYLEDAGIQQWARCYQSENRYDNMTSNSVECFNAFTKEPRVLPITLLLEYTRGLLQGWFHDRQIVWSNSTSPHPISAEEIMGLECEKSRQCRVNPIDCYRFHVKDGRLDGIISLNTRECSCKQFQCLEISCSHAIVAARERNINPFTLCSKFYSVDSLVIAYAESINPLGHVSEWKKPPGYTEVKIFHRKEWYMLVDKG
ncbi:uncharacterized protein LOC120077410 [Benincasa hispida]|uniref:uncharacterized protein LOC120077410 n=1 Tax=Benincasa hispida TaxID=102211 RepID=UPI001902724B|nr:uncharacterized protein LOC120077410 [Benincasa hispida]